MVDTLLALVDALLALPPNDEPNVPKELTEEVERKLELELELLSAVSDDDR